MMSYKVDIKSTKLYDCGGDLKKRWRIVFKVWDYSQNKFIRRFDYDVNKLESLSDRYRFAKKRIKEINQLLIDGFVINAPSKPKFTIKSAFNQSFELKKNEYSERTKESIKSVVSLFLYFLESRGRVALSIKELGKNDFLEFRDFLLVVRGVAPRTANNYAGYINIMVNFMVSRGWLSVNPFNGIRKLKQNDTLKHREISSDEREKLKPHLKKNKALWLFVQFVYYCWLRPREITFLRVKNIDLVNGKIFLNANDTKNKKSNFVNIPGPFLEELKKMDFPKIGNQFVFARDGKNKLFGYKKYADNRFTMYHSKIRDNLGMSKEINLYGWKRSGVCDAYRCGVGIWEIMGHGRWQDLKEVQTYLKKSGLLLNNDIIIKMPKI